MLKLMVSWSCFGAEERRKEETITLRRPPEIGDTKTTRRRSGVKSSDDWKPSLYSISEHKVHVIMAAAPDGGTGDRRTVAAKSEQAGPAVRKNGRNRSRTRVHVRGSSDDYRSVIRSH